MKFYTVIRKRTVWRVRAKSVQQLTQALNDLGIKFQSVWEDQA